MSRIALLLLIPLEMLAQGLDLKNRPESGNFSLGLRSTISTFNNGRWGNIGTGVGGQFRLQFSSRLNTEWFADYLTSNVDGQATRQDAHIGWSVMFYPLNQAGFDQLMKPYVLAGHCFDYTRLKLLDGSNTQDERWSAAVQAGVGNHINMTPKLDLTVIAQYMIHLGDDLHVTPDAEPTIEAHRHGTMEGHLLFTLGVNYKFADLW